MFLVVDFPLMDSSGEVPGEHSLYSEDVHRLFRGAAEIGKLLTYIAWTLEVTIAACAAFGLLAPNASLRSWLPLIVLLLAIVAVCFRTYAQSVRRYAERCRRESASSYAHGVDMQAGAVAFLHSDAPPLADWIARRLPAGSLAEYYDPKSTAGEGRLREVYAHSAFVTWHLLRSWSYTLAVIAFLLIITSFVIMYRIVIEPIAQLSSDIVLDIMCSFILAFLFLRVLEAAISARSGTHDTRIIAERLTTRPLPSGAALTSIINAYDFERSGGSLIPTVFYRYQRTRLARLWELCRRDLEHGRDRTDQ